MPARIDGRRLRSRRTEERLVVAYLDLTATAGTPPTCNQVAARAGCSVRTLFDRFRDMAELARAAIARASVLEGDCPAGPPASLDRAARIRLHVATRARLCERSLAVSARLSDGAEAADVLSGLAEIETLFGPELSALDAADRRRLVIALGTLTDVGGWAGIRQRFGTSMEEACDVWQAAMDRLLPATPVAAAGPGMHAGEAHAISNATSP